MTETITIEKQVWESTLHRSMVLQAENGKLKEKIEKQLKIVKKYLPLIKRNVSVGSLAYTHVANAQTKIKELENEKTPQSI